MKYVLFILAVVAVLLTTAVLLYPKTGGPWTGYITTSDGRFVADSSHASLEECQRYIGTHSGGLCGLECTTGRNCKKLVSVPELASVR